MDRGLSASLELAQDFPHARGDGPLANAPYLACRLFSPRTWGWTVFNWAKENNIRIFPTHVGMDRASTISSEEPRDFPHARGDGPPCSFHLLSSAKFSPRTWGWTVFFLVLWLSYNIFPTHVGMDRILPSVVAVIQHFPHARGDGPIHNSRRNEAE